MEKIDWTKPIRHMKGAATYLGEFGGGLFPHCVRLRTGIYQYDDYGRAPGADGKPLKRGIFQDETKEVPEVKGMNGSVMARQLKLIDRKLDALMSNLGVALPQE